MAEYIEKEKLEVEESTGFDYRKLWSIVVLNWYWIILSVILFVSAAFIYLRYQTPVYQSFTKVLIKDDKGKKSGGQDIALDQLGLITNSNGFDNELEILSSTAVATRAVKELKLYVTYHVKGRITEAELYKTSPYIVDLDEAHLELLEVPITIEMTKIDGGIHVLVELPMKEGVSEFIERDLTAMPCMLTTKLGKILFTPNPGFEMPERPITVVIYPPIAIGRFYAASLDVSPTSKTTTVALLSLNDTHLTRARDYLLQLVQSYNDDADEDKNEVARKTAEFINERIDVIREELDMTESKIEVFKRDNSLINLPTDASQALTQATDFQKRQVEIQTQMALVKSLIDFVNVPTNCNSVIPSNIGIASQEINKMIADYNQLVLNRDRLIRSSSENSPLVIQKTEEIATMWEAVGTQLRTLYKNLEIQKKSVDQQYALFTGKVSSTPRQERTMNNYGRQQEVKAGLYLMLLQKREENAINLNSTANKARIIDQPQKGKKVSPRTSIILLASFLFGLFFPIGLFYLRDMMRFRIEGRDDLEKQTKINILADIPLTRELGEGERAIVVKENTNNMMEEAFRGLRTNLRFLLGPGEKVIATTSSMPGEGKTFVATNLAMSLALLGKKVIILGLDIRKPRLVKLFGLPSNKKGITSFLVGEKADYDLLEEQIFRGVANENLDVLPAGIIPPNPGELITRDLLDQALEYFKTKYDYIIIDTPPVGLVSDTFELGRLFNITFFVVRSEKTTRSDVDMINRINEEGRLPRINLVFNGVDLKKKKYGFYYGYGRYGGYSKYGTYYGRYGHYGSYGHYGDRSQHVEK